MNRAFIYILPLAAAMMLAAGCQTSQTNTNTNTAPTASVTPTPLPPGFSSTPTPQGGTPPAGIPAPSAQPTNPLKSEAPPAGIPDPQAQNRNSNRSSEATTPSRGTVAPEQGRRRP